jgi:hypothetical protein
MQRAAVDVVNRSLRKGVTPPGPRVVTDPGTTAPILSSHVQKGALKVVGARYDLDSGTVTLIA